MPETLGTDNKNGGAMITRSQSQPERFTEPETHQNVDFTHFGRMNGGIGHRFGFCLLLLR